MAMMTQTQSGGKGPPTIHVTKDGPGFMNTMTIQQFYAPTWWDHGEWLDYYQVPRRRARWVLRTLRRRNPGLEFRVIPTERDPDNTRQEASRKLLKLEAEAVWLDEGERKDANRYALEK
jgi:hypothetical protein